MELEERQQFSSPTPVLPRLDRLDRLLQYLEEKESLSRRHPSSPLPTKMELDKHCKPLSSALEEVHSKGTLMERVAMLENRVLQLSLQMDEGNTSKSSSSTIPVPENIRHGFPAMQDGGVSTLEEKQDPVMIQEKTFGKAWTRTPQGSRKSRRHIRTSSITRYRKWLGWFRMGC